LYSSPFQRAATSVGPTQVSRLPRHPVSLVLSSRSILEVSYAYTLAA